MDLDVLFIHPVLTGQSVQLFGDRGHNDVILHDVCHLVKQVLLIERDQGIRAGIPNLNESLIMAAVYKSMLLEIPFPYIELGREATFH